MRTLYLIPFLYFSLMPLAQNGTEALNIYTYEIEGLHQSDGKGKYDRVISEVFPQKYPYRLENRPPKRALRDFEQCKSCCISPMNDNPAFYNYAATLGAVQLPALNTAIAYAFNQYGNQPTTKISQLAGKVIAHRRGMSFGREFDESAKRLEINIIQVPDFDSLFKMLETGRIDAALAYTPDVLLFFKEREIQPYTYAKSHPVVMHEDALLCKNISHELIELYRENMGAFLNSSGHRAIMGESLQIMPKGIGKDFSILK